jgi:hypothetical protein
MECAEYMGDVSPSKQGMEGCRFKLKAQKQTVKIVKHAKRGNTIERSPDRRWPFNEYVGRSKIRRVGDDAGGSWGIHSKDWLLRAS